MADKFIGSTFPSVRFIGAVQLACRVSKTRLIMQGAAIKKNALKPMEVTDPELYDVCTRKGSHDDLHDQDALMHLYYYSFKHYERFKGTK